MDAGKVQLFYETSVIIIHYYPKFLLLNIYRIIRHPTFWEQAIERHQSFLSQVELDNEGITDVSMGSHMGQNNTPLVSLVQYPWTRNEDKDWMT
jgi:hypothetical protein